MYLRLRGEKPFTSGNRRKNAGKDAGMAGWKPALRWWPRRIEAQRVISLPDDPDSRQWSISIGRREAHGVLRHYQLRRRFRQCFERGGVFPFQAVRRVEEHNPGLVARQG